jgi:hypothetical protein
MNELLLKIANHEDGVEALVFAHSKGFIVSLRDLDSGETVSSHKIFAQEEKAFSYAHKVAGVCSC